MGIFRRKAKKPSEDTPHYDTGRLEKIRDDIDKKLKKKGLTRDEEKDLRARRDEINRRFRDESD